MNWILFLQIVLLVMWTGLIFNTVVNNIITHRWKEERKFYDHYKGLDHEADDLRGVSDAPEPYTRYEAA